MKVLQADIRLRDANLARIALLVSLVLHAALGLTIVLTGTFSIQRPREQPRAIDLLSIKDLLPPPVKPPEALRAAAAPLVAPLPAHEPSQAPTPAPAQPAVPAPTPSPAPALAEDLSPADASSGSMTVATGPAAPTNAAEGAPKAGGEPDYLPQFRITDVPIVPAKAVLARIEYPPLAAKQGIEANVFLELFIDDTGKIRKITVLKDPGYGFAQAAIAALSGIACTPAMVDGQPVAVRFRYPVRFTLK